MIIYLHGFRSSPRSHKAWVMQAHLSRLGLAERFWCPQLPVDPKAAIELVAERIGTLYSTGIAPVLVGSSLGGYYATHLAERFASVALKAVLLNPAIVAHRSLADYVGIQTSYHGGEPFEFTAAHVEALRALEVGAITRPERYLLVVETGDELLDYRVAIKRYLGANMIVVAGGDHALQSFPRQLGAILEFAGIST